ncbi:MAG TPA: DPP IV N-terminal domain-containing protein, partial [Pyrinomonadaceae bacterium]
MFKLSLAIAVTFFSILHIAAQSNAPMQIGNVSVNQNKVAFTYAGKIWLVDKNGGAATQLSNAAGEETNPVFSPDGQRIAFSRANGGDLDVYVAAADGKSEVRRLTFQGEDDFAVTWTPDGREIVFQSTRDEEGVNRFYKIAVENGGLETALPLPQAEQGTFSPDGTKIAYNPRAFAFGEWRYYRGGMTAPIWITDLKTGALEKLPNQNYNDRNPMWIGDKIYFVSDRTGIFNLFEYDGKTKQFKQLTKFEAQGIRTASASGDAICFVQNGRLHLFDLATGQDKTIDVKVTPDTSELRARTVPAMRSFEVVYPSANGEKLIFGARGEALLFDAASGEAKNLTNTPGAAERFPNLSPDGKSVAYFSDESGEYALHVRSVENGAVKKIEIESKPTFYWDINWSPDSRKLAFADRRLSLWLADAEKGIVQKIDVSGYSAQESWQPNWSSDSRFLAYNKRMKNRTGTVFIYDAAQQKSFQITDGITHTESPVFDKNGKYLYFISSPNAGTSEYSWGVLNGVFARSGVVRRVHALLLTKDTLSPLLPNGQPNADAKTEEIVPQVRIDFDNVSRRFVDLPLPQRDYYWLTAGSAGKLFLITHDWSETPGAELGQPRNYSVYNYDLTKLGNMQKIVGEIGGAFEISRDGSKLLFQKGRDWFLTAAETAPKPDEGKLNLSKMEVRVEPAAEWRQMFRESMRIMRDWFYDPNLHGQNPARLEREYAAYLPTVTRRNDLNRLMLQMLGQVSIS